jgi:hypothetical protein
MSPHNAGKVFAKYDVLLSNQRINSCQHLQRKQLESQEFVFIAAMSPATAVVVFHRTAYEHRRGSVIETPSNIGHQRSQPVSLNHDSVNLLSIPSQVAPNKQCESES